jgi:hypothetical protein
VVAKDTEPKKALTVQEARVLFPSELEAMLSFEEKEGSIIIKPKQFLGSDNFGKVAAIVRAAGGEYISQGKTSHFKIKRV